MLQVHLANNNDERRRLYEFRYRVHVEEMGLEPQGTYHKLHAVRDDFDVNAKLYFLTDNSNIIGSVRVLICDAPLLPRMLVDCYQLRSFEDYDPSQLSLSDQFIIAEGWREGEASSILLGAKYKQLRKLGVKFDFCNVTPSLVPAFEILGYRRFNPNFVDPMNGLKTPLVLVTEDFDHLNAVGSPFASLAEEYENSSVDTEWLLEKYPSASQEELVSLEDRDGLWSHVTARIHQAPLQGVPLFDGMGVMEAQRLMKNGVLLNLNAGDLLIRQGDVGNEMYIILSGDVEIRKDGKVITNLSAGDVIGEIGFLSANPRTADAKVIQDGEFLILTQEMFHKAMRSMPETSARALFNLSLILCERLKNSTQSWVDGVSDIDSQVDS